MDSIKITGTKWYVDIEYKGSIARFDGEMCVDGFYATANSLSWIKRSREISADDFPKLIDAVMQQNKKILLKCIFAMMTVVSTNDLGKVGFLWQRASKEIMQNEYGRIITKPLRTLFRRVYRCRYI